MKYFCIEPEVAGGLGARTAMDRSVHPPIVKRLHYEFEGWLGDAIVESFPVFVVTEDARKLLLDAQATGASFDNLEITVSDQFLELYPDRALPVFAWLKPFGEAGLNDIGTAADGRLVVSQPVLDALRSLGIPNALVEPFDDPTV